MPEEQKKRKLTHHESTPVEYASLPLRGFNGARERTKTRKRNLIFSRPLPFDVAQGRSSPGRLSEGVRSPVDRRRQRRVNHRASRERQHNSTLRLDVLCERHIMKICVYLRPINSQILQSSIDNRQSSIRWFLNSIFLPAGLPAGLVAGEAGFPLDQTQPNGGLPSPPS